MSKKITLFALFATISMGLYSQRPAMELTFTAENNGVYVQLESIKVMNRTQGGDTVLYWPDTVLLIDYVGMPEISFENNTFKVLRNYPNPVTEQTTVSIYVPEKDKVSIFVTDILGRVMVQTARVLDKGKHSFRFKPGNGNLYFFSATWQGHSSGIKIVSHSSDGSACLMEYLGGEPLASAVKSTEDIHAFSFTPGDELLYIGYANALESGMLDSPQESTTYTFQFATNIPCPGMPTVEYEGQVYNTIQIFSQCWLKENLNVGDMIPGGMEQSNNGTIEKYCYEDTESNCNTYGGLYQWHEIMQYTTQQGARGICPPGWHIPKDEEWKVLEGAVDSQYGIGDPLWDAVFSFRGYDAGTNLKTTSGWYANGNGTDLFGFSGLPGASRVNYGSYFYYVSIYGYWWSSTEGDNVYAWARSLYYGLPEVYRNYYDKVYGFSVRCIKDN